nr:hypothetical protein [uncultured archaeon]
MSKSDAKEKYESAIKEFGGYDQYKSCGKPNNVKVKDIADCLIENKTVTSTSDMVSRYGDAYA